MSIEEVRALVAERQRYDDWLAALEAKRTETPVRVYERVHGDYLARRTQVVEQLQSHVDTLATLGNDLERQLDGLDAQLATLEDERAEAMLRNMVGEFDSERWEAVRVEVEGKMETLGAERSALLTQFDDVRTLLASARIEQQTATAVEPEALTPEAEAPEAATAVTAVEVGVGAEAEVEVEAEVDSAAEAAQEPTSEPTSEHELVDLGSQFNLPAVEAPVEAADAGLEVEAIFEAAERIDRHTPRAHDIVTHIVSDIPPVAEPRVDNEFDDALAMFSDSGNAPDSTFVNSLEGIEVEVDVPSVDPTTRTATPPTSAPSAGAPSAGFDDLAFLRSVINPSGGNPAVGSVPDALPSATGAEPQKTLRCTECGTMNLPTEWYCERCGGELAAF
ncbi:hypothetical protein [Gemmatimonas sp. UBA7669]|uniref:hypothetical protein n=1 Tax=Gemmatimonas sp. UBA7669 TaxID=1946568 RepID=UPI0025C1020F|nr:hypothetical protein [Gemmatimonas sp. UBA7669]